MPVLSVLPMRECLLTSAQELTLYKAQKSVGEMSENGGEVGGCGVCAHIKH